MYDGTKRKKGYLYIATGDKFVQEATISAQSLKSSVPNPSIAIITEKSQVDDVFDIHIEVDNPNKGFEDQINYLNKTPFKKTIYLDTDTYVNSDIDDIYDILERFDVCVAINHNRQAYTISDVPDSFPEYNTGVVGYELNPDFQKFLSTWKEYYQELSSPQNIQNQPAFRKALFYSSLQISTLRPEDNLMIRYAGHSKNRIRVFHGRLLDLTTPGSDVLIPPEKVINKLNSPSKNIREASIDSDHRVWIQEHTLRGRRIITYSDRRTYPKIAIDVLNNIREEGIVKTFKKSIKKLKSALSI